MQRDIAFVQSDVWREPGVSSNLAENFSVNMIAYTRLLIGTFLLIVLGVAVGCNSDPATKTTEKLEQQRRAADPEALSLLVEAQQIYHQGAYRRALALTDSVQKRAPELADVYFLRGHIFSELKRFNQAQESYQKVTSMVPAYKGIWYNLGNNEFRQGNFRQAITFYQKEQQYHPSAQTLTNLGRSYMKLSNVDSAAWAFKKATALDSTYASAYMRLGQLYEDEGELEKALHYSQQGLSLKPENLDYKYIVGSQLYRTNKAKEAVEHLRPVVENRPSHHGAHYNLGQALVRLGRQKEAEGYLAEADSLEEVEADIKGLRSVAQSNPSNLQAWLKLGAKLRDTQRWEEAVEVYKVAWSIQPQSIVAQGNLANLYQAQGQMQKALTQYRLILKQDPTQVEAWFNTGVIHANAGRKQQAEAAWQKVLQYNPNHQKTRAYLAKLKSK